MNMARNRSTSATEPAMTDVEECHAGEQPTMKTEEGNVIKNMINEAIEDTVTVNSRKDTEGYEQLLAAIDRVYYLMKENKWQGSELERNATSKLFEKLPSNVRFQTYGRIKFTTLSHLKEFVAKHLSRANTVECVPSVAKFVRKAIELHPEEDEERQSWDLFMPIKPEEGDRYMSRQLFSNFSKNA